MADAGHDDGARAGEIRRRLAASELRAHRRESLAHRGQVAGAVIDQRNGPHALSLLPHSSPLVLGSVRASCRSREHAKRSARANALNSASIW